MQLATTLSQWRASRRPLFVAIGFFDGVHRGHAQVIGSALRQARACSGDAWVLTFDPHPARILHPPAAPRLLTALPHKLAELERLGVHGCMVLPFTRALAARSPQQFLERLHRAAPTLAEVFVGANWRFGHGRSGTPELLSRFAHAHGFRVSVVSPAVRAGAPVSSTRIRAAVARGQLATAAAMLGRPYHVVGTVVRGAQLGRVLGFPTANIEPLNEVLPPYGIYAVWARVGRRCLPGVLSYGVRPTIHHGPHAPAVLELHLLDFNGNLYGRRILVAFVRRLRAERRFATRAALIRQIARDVAAARLALHAHPLEKESLGTMPSRVLYSAPSNIKERKRTQGKARR